jgi:predicted ATPase
MITGIQIDRFKNLHHTSLLKMSRVNILSGANGRGKSSFCQSLLMLSQTWRRGMMESFLPSGMWKDLGTYDDIVFAFDNDKTISIHIITDAVSENDFELLYRRSHDNPTLGELQDVKVGGMAINDDSGSSDEEDESSEGDEDGQSEVGIRLASLRDFPSLMALQRMYYVAAERIAAPNHQLLDETTPYDYLAPNGENVLNVLWKYRNSGCIERVEEMLKRVLDDGRIKLETAGDRLILLINSVDDGNYYQPVNVGYGYSYILSLITAVVLAPKDSFIIVENPEAHLHPSAQATMINELLTVAKERDIQLIIETHSDHVLNTALRAVHDHRIDLEDLEVLFFSKSVNEDEISESKVRNLEINRLGHIINPPKQFFEQYSIDLRALYTPSSHHE